jgi:DNA-binding transcriptional LysR family regulator
LVPVCSPTHPLAEIDTIDDATLDEHVHLVFAGTNTGPDLLGVSQGLKWRLTDMDLRLTLLRDGLGWARMPIDRIQADLDTGRLVRLNLRRWSGQKMAIEFVVLSASARPPGPVGLWLREEAKRLMTSVSD